MKSNFLRFGFYAVMFAMTLFVTSCGSGEHDHEGHNHQHEQGQQHDHDHEGHDHEQGQHDHEQGEQASSIDKTGKEYTSAYICPMKCAGSGSDKAGKCPSCDMPYIANADLKKPEVGEEK